MIHACAHMHAGTPAHTHTLTNEQFSFYSWLDITSKLPTCYCLYVFPIILYVKEGKGTNRVKTRERKSVASQDTL